MITRYLRHVFTLPSFRHKASSINTTDFINTNIPFYEHRVIKPNTIMESLTTSTQDLLFPDTTISLFGSPLSPPFSDKKHHTPPFNGKMNHPREVQNFRANGSNGYHIFNETEMFDISHLTRSLWQL